ncbi:MAG: PQQ-dependent dehydrogenase, methanol/ethanol family [Porticoccaceae bacterium]|jgi:quinohemoprotein ethanol dehydrogenase|nr:PQQ-dependent dehydrogenase, methanol/ethanol family [Porticoccaceae bacterium]MBT7905717.1 PQQ-dependent dehydrogenase, methanol/ethanol family [Porticoccaceae bacterium]
MASRLIQFATALLFSSALIQAQATVVNEQSITDPDTEWLSYGRNYKEQRFSPLDKINRDNVDELDLAWSFKFDTARGMEATPLMHDGVLYVSTGWAHVHALDARTGEELWHFDAEVPREHLIKACCGAVNRGVAMWQGDEETGLQVFFGTLDGRLIALDAKTGEQNWSIQTTPANSNYSVTGAPRVVDGKIIIGNGGAELGVRGYITAYDTATGDQLWRFYTVPGNPNKPQEHPALDVAVETWGDKSWHELGGGGGTVWDSIVYDPELDLLYIGTGNGSPWNRDLRSPGGGDNLYVSSIVALRPDTGDYVWHYQVTPKDNWDYTATQQMTLADIEIKGEMRQVIMQAPKNGFFYVLDRATGELLSAEPFAKVTWASHIDMETGRPVETEYADYQSNGGSYIWPSPYGAHNWQPMSFSPKTGLMYIPAQSIPHYFSAQKTTKYQLNRWNTGVDLNESRDPLSWVAGKASTDALVYGELLAWDPVKQEAAWKVHHSKPANGGILSTEGDLVFQGMGNGTFAAYDAENGDALWQYQSDSAVLAGPMTFELDGEQYIAVAQGSGGTVMLTIGDELKRNKVNQNKLLVFKLGDFGHTRSLPDESLASILALGHEANTDPEIIKKGEELYGHNCGTCHGISAKSNYVVPDLRYMSEQTHIDFAGIVLGGSKAHKGMVGFYETNSMEDAEAIHAYLDRQQQRLPEMVEMTFAQKIEYWFTYGMAKLGTHFPGLLNATRDMSY